MFGEIIDIYDDVVILENRTRQIDTNYLNIHIVFNDNNRKIIGEIINISKNEIKVSLIGEIINDRFVSGLVRKPNLSSGCRIIYKSEVELLVGSQDLDNLSSF